MKRSALSRTGSLVGLIYLAYLCFELMYAENPRAFLIEAAGFSLRMAVFLPCAIVTAAAVLLGWIGFAAKKRGPLLAAAVLYLGSLPIVIEMYAIPLALSLLALADFFASLVREGKLGAPEAGGEGDTGDPGGTYLIEDVDDALKDDSAGGSDDGLNGGFDAEPYDGDSGDDLRLEALLQDVTDTADDENLPRADGVAVFLGIFMGLAALALIAIVVCGVMGVKLPFML